jgi:hypothetical protein
MTGVKTVVPAVLCVRDAATQSANREEAPVVDQSVSQPETPTEPVKPSDTPTVTERLDGDLLNGGSGQTTSTDDPPNQGANPAADDDLLNGGSGEPDPA